MKALNVAAHIINKCIDLDMPVSNLKLQKMLYFLDMTYLVNTGKRLIDEDFEAWQYGPVIKDVYERFSSYAATPIELKQDFSENFPSKYANEIQQKINNLARIRTSYLVDISHKEGTPWDIVYNNGMGNHRIISNTILYEYAKNIRGQKK